MDNLMEASLESLNAVDDMGEIMAESVYEFFAQPQTKDLVERLKNYGVNMQALEEESSDLRFDGKIFVLTGALESFSRKEAEEIIEKFGGKTSSSVSKKTSFVLAGEDSGSKLTKARELGVNVITEEEFKQMIEN